MKILFTFLLGMTAGVGLVRITEGLSSAQMHLLWFFCAGAALGLAAAGICAIGGGDDE